jgi:class 3 adenylate cyclase
MIQTPPRSRERAVLFADLVGSTQLYERMGDTAAFALIDRCLNIMSDAVIGSSGTVIKMTGDGLLATFRACDHAAETALSIHHEIDGPARSRRISRSASAPASTTGQCLKQVTTSTVNRSTLRRACQNLRAMEGPSFRPKPQCD